MKRRLACLYCGARVRARKRYCTACNKAIIHVLDGRFEVRQLLGCDDGRLSLAARDRETRREVFIRALTPTAGAGLQSELANEARLLKHLRGEAGFPAFVHGGRLRNTGGLYLAVEFVTGKPLSKVCRRAKPREVIDLLLRAMEPLNTLHGIGVAHCAVCLEHFMVTGSGQVVLIDFRQARSCGAVGYGQGRPGYQSPEQLRGAEVVGAAADVFALGVCLYKVLTRSYPYGARGPKRLMKPGYQPKRPSEHNPKVTSDLDGIVMQALDRDPARRFTSAGELQKALTTGFGAVTRVDGLGYTYPSLCRQLVERVGRGMCALGVGAWWVLQNTASLTAALARMAHADPVRFVTAALLTTVIPALVLVRVSSMITTMTSAASPAVTDTKAITATTSITTTAATAPTALRGQEDSEPGELARAHAEGEGATQPDAVHYRIQFLTWPAAYVYVDGLFVVEAPSSEAFIIEAGSHEVHLVSKVGEQRDVTLDLSPRAAYVLEHNFETGRLDILEVEAWPDSTESY